MSVAAVQDSQPILATGIPFAAQGGEQAPFANQSDTPSFWDLVDMVNPLQHIPVVSTLYRAVTGDEIGAVPRIVGGTLFGGPLGLIGAIANEVVRKDTGQDLGEHALAYLFPGSQQAPQTEVAGNAPAAAPLAAMTMQPFDAPDALAQADSPAEPPPAMPQPLLPVAMAPLVAPAPQQQMGAISGNLFVPLNRPVSLEAEPAAAASAPAVPPPAPQASAETVVPQEAVLISQQLASSGALQPLAPRPVQSAASSAEPKTFAAKASPLQHGKLFAAAQPYMTRTEPAQKVAQAEGIPATHPMLKAAESGQSDWMAGAMAQALDKYSKTQRLMPGAETASPPS